VGATRQWPKGVIKLMSGDSVADLEVHLIVDVSPVKSSQRTSSPNGGTIVTNGSATDTLAPALPPEQPQGLKRPRNDSRDSHAKPKKARHGRFIAGDNMTSADVEKMVGDVGNCPLQSAPACGAVGTDHDCSSRCIVDSK
jgi:hypothetical protein